MAPFESAKTHNQNEEELHSGDEESMHEPAENNLTEALFKPTTFVLERNERNDECDGFTFQASLVCDDGIPQFSKLVDLIAGTFEVASARASVSPKNAGSVEAIHDNSGLLRVFKESTDLEIIFHVAIKIPPHLKLTLKDAGESFAMMFDSSSVLTRKGGKPSFTSLLQLAASGLNILAESDIVKILANGGKRVIATDNDLLNLLEATSSEVAEFIVVQPILLISIEGQDKLPPLKIGYSSIANAEKIPCPTKLQECLAKEWKVGSMKLTVAATGSILADSTNILVSMRNAPSELVSVTATPDPIVLRDKHSLPFKFQQPKTDIASWAMENIVPGRYEVSWTAAGSAGAPSQTEVCCLSVGLVHLNQGEDIVDDNFIRDRAQQTQLREFKNIRGTDYQVLQTKSKALLISGAANEILVLSMAANLYPFNMRHVTLIYDGPLSILIFERPAHYYVYNIPTFSRYYLLA